MTLITRPIQHGNPKLRVDKARVDEGEVITFTMYAGDYISDWHGQLVKNYEPGERIRLELAGDTDRFDFAGVEMPYASANYLTYYTTVDNNFNATWKLLVREDNYTDGNPETFKAFLSDSEGPYTSVSVTINDTSKTESNNGTQNIINNGGVVVGGDNNGTINIGSNYGTFSVNVPGWSRELNLNAKVSNNDSEIRATQLSYSDGSLPATQSIEVAGSSLTGGNGANKMYGLAGWDIIDAGAGNDSVRGGNGRDVITGGVGSDELWGDFGWNTYLSNDDGSKDLIVIKSDQLLENWWYGKAGNNANGEKADIITELDAFDQIKILGANTSEITIGAATAHGQSGLGIYAGGFLEAVYTGSNLNEQQLLGIVTGDASSSVLNNTQGFYGV